MLNLLIIILIVILILSLSMFILGHIWSNTCRTPFPKLMHDILNYHNPGEEPHDYKQIKYPNPYNYPFWENPKVAFKCKYCDKYIVHNGLSGLCSDWEEIDLYDK